MCWTHMVVKPLQIWDKINIWFFYHFDFRKRDVTASGDARLHLHNSYVKMENYSI